MSMDATTFINKYFIEPIYTDEGYNIYNTLAYALLTLAVLAVLYKVLQKLNFRIDNKFFYAIFPFILFGSSLRAFVDAGIYKAGFWTVTPGVYFLSLFIFLGIFFASLAAEKFTKIQYWKTTIGAGAILLAIHVGLVASKIHFANIGHGLAVLGLAAGITFALFFIFKFTKFGAGRKFFLPFPAHMLDASSTFIAVDFLGASEKHVLPIFVTSHVGTAAVMYVLKLLVLIPLAYFLNKDFKNGNFAHYLAIAVATLGFAQGIRNLLAILIV